MITEETLFSIPEWNIDKLRSKVAILQGKAQKLNVEPVTLTEHHEGFIDEIDPNTQRPTSRKVKCVFVSINGNAPKLAGWSFIGRIEHSSEYGNLLHESPSCEIPHQYRDAESTCDHCQTKRYRKDTFIVQSEAGEFKQVGRTCLKDFLGHPDPESIVSLLTSLWSFVSDLSNTSDESEFYNGSAGVYYSEINKVLEVTSATIRKYGWVSKTKAYETVGLTTTASLVALILFGKGRDSNALRDSIEITNDDKKAAQNAIEFVKLSEDDSNYFHNLKRIVATGHVSEDKFGYICSIIPTYNKYLERKNALEYKDEWVGTIKKRMEFKATLLKTFFIENKFNGITLHIMVDEEGRSIKWASSTGIGEIKDRFDDTEDPENDYAQIGETYYITATVKEHGYYRDQYKQTAITRCEFRLKPKSKKKAKKKAA